MGLGLRVRGQQAALLQGLQAKKCTDLVGGRFSMALIPNGHDRDTVPYLETPAMLLANLGNLEQCVYSAILEMQQTNNELQLVCRCGK